MRNLSANAVAILLLGCVASAAHSQSMAPSVAFVFNGQQIEINNDNPRSQALTDSFGQRSEQCAAYCPVPMQLEAGIVTYGEREVLDFLKGHVAQNTGLMIDARQPDSRNMGHIPGSVSLPHSTMMPDNIYRDDILLALGAQKTDEGFSFDQARALLVYDTGPNSNDAGTLVRHLLSVGYPADRITYYRGGMLMWAALGFTIEAGSS